MNVWLDQTDIPVGKNWPKAIEDALEACNRFLVILSPASVQSQNVMSELDFAIDEHKQIFPVLYLECKRPFRIRSSQYADFTTNYEHGLETLLDTLSADGRRIAPRTGRQAQAHRYWRCLRSLQPE